MALKNSEGTNVEIINDGEITLAIGRSRKEMRWKNKGLLWSLFVQKVSRTIQTHETMSEYLKADKSRQAEIKDVGGFVGGTLSGGKRRSDSVSARSMLTLDLDFVNGSADDFWMLFSLIFCNASLVYSTHKHTREKPRLRLVIPLDREVTPAEYIAIARRIAGLLGIEQFDDSTYEPERLMYWPSTAKDAEYYFKVQDGAWVGADAILASYKNWQDTSEWPVSNRQGDAVRREIKKQENPLEKKGIIGAFCRTYGIHKAVETFLREVYEACDVDNRYTYKGGSSAAGMVVYDDTFAYSHHGTDPASGQLCNAFDLVRVHLYGDRDEGVEKNGTRKDRYPSFVAMEDLCTQDKETRRTVAAEKLQSAGEDFAGIMSEDGGNIWLDDMETDKKGNYLSSQININRIFENDPKIQGCFAYDLFRDQKVILKNPPWRNNGDHDKYLRDDDEANLRAYLSCEPWGIDSRQKIADGLDITCRKNAFHPVRNYFEELVWDGVERLDTLFIDYLGAEDTELNRVIARLMFVAGVYRAYEPGTKFDQITVLVGAQGCGKSTLVEKMSICPDWFTSSMPSPEDPAKAAAHLRGKFFVEVGELASFKKAENESIKNFLSKTADDFRPAWGKNELHRKRQCVFFGTTNEDSFLRDATGNRRYWPVKVAVAEPKYVVWEDLTQDVVSQIWAEAIQLYKQKPPLMLPKRLEAELNEIRETYDEVDEWQGIIEEFLNRRLPENWGILGTEQRKNYFQTEDPTYARATLQRTKVCAAEILNECPYLMIRGTVTKVERNRIGAVMRNLEGWTKNKSASQFGPYGSQKCWKLVEEANPESIY